MNFLAERPTSKNIFLDVTPMALSFKEVNYKDADDIFSNKKVLATFLFKRVKI